MDLSRIRLPRWSALPAFLLLAGVAYWPAISGKFLWDDHGLVATNPWIRSPVFVGEAFRHWLQPSVNSPYYRPIQTLSFQVDYWFWNVTPAGYHVTNILLQGIAGFCLYLLLTRILPLLSAQDSHATRRSAVAIAAIWTVHPIHNAAVAYISGRADVLGFIFGSVGVMCGLFAVDPRHSAREKWVSAGCAVLLFLTAACSKELSIIWAGLFLALVFAFLKTSWPVRFTALAAGLAVVLAWWGLRHLPAEPPLAANAIATTAPQRFVLLFRALGDYVSLIVAPVHLHMERMVWPEWMNAHTTWALVPRHLGTLGWLGLSAALLSVAAVFLRMEGRRLRVFGLGWFALCFTPISNLVPLNAQVAEHWIYLASVGALLFLYGLWLPYRQHVVVARATPALLGVVVLSFTLRTMGRAYEWADPVRFYRQTIQAMGGTPRVFNNLGVELQVRGQKEQSEMVFREALNLYPNYPTLLSNLGGNLVNEGRIEEGKALLEKARQVSVGRVELGSKVQSQSDLSVAKLQRRDGNVAGALDTLQKARVVFPNQWDLAKYEAELRYEAEGVDAALPVVEQFARPRWWHKDAQMLAARMYRRKGDLPSAKRTFRAAARLDVWDPEPWSELAEIEADAGNFAEAAGYQQHAVKRAPGRAEPLLALSGYLRAEGNDPDAAVALMEAREIEKRLGQPVSAPPSRVKDSFPSGDDFAPLTR